MILFRTEESGYLIESCLPSGLPTMVYTYPRQYLDDLPAHFHVPSILVSNIPGRGVIWSDDNSMVRIAERPRILDGRCKLTSTELALVFRWIAINQVILIGHWEGSTDTCELYDDLKPLTLPIPYTVWTMEGDSCDGRAPLW
jgi:hypothetical protein